jgi:2-polyprenyl-3-methyl-5-hydroxy-6-metoxy-1,4-benzoquinol methylase
VRLDDVEETWRQIGKDDPLWGVLSWDGTEHGRWDLEQFFAQGEQEIARFLAEAEALGISINRGSVLDFGCGVGRLSRALATRFDAVQGVDISQPMIDQARRLVGEQHPNCRFDQSLSERLPYPSTSFDLVLTNIVLQHVPPRIAGGYIREFVRLLGPGGVAIFQVPSEAKVGSTSSRPYVRAAMNALPSQWREEIFRRRTRQGPRDLPMHGIPRPKVIRDVERHGGRVTACVEDAAAGTTWRSFHYFVTSA